MLAQAAESSRRNQIGSVAGAPLRPLPTIPHITQGILEGATNFKIENSTLTNVHGNTTIFRFDGVGSLTEDLKSVILQHITGSITVQDLDKLKRGILGQSVHGLPRANAAYNDYTANNRKRVACFEGTRYALLLEIGEWAVDPTDCPFYILFGIAGVGKSTIAQTFSEKADVLRLLGASFFFSRDEADRKTAAKFFTSIVFQLCMFNESFAQAIGQVLSQEEGIAVISKEPHEQLNVLILEPLRGVVKLSPLPILIVVDALDECDEQDREVVVAELKRLVRELPPFKVFLTTRPHPHLEGVISIGDAHKIFRLEDIEKKVVDSDIRVYLQHSLSHEQVKQALRNLQKPWSASDGDIDSLVQAAGQLFIVASTSVRFILDTTARRPATRMQMLLDTSPQGRTPLKALDDFYTVILRCAVPKYCDNDILEDYQAVVGAIIVIQIPLPVQFLADLIDVPEERIYGVLDSLQSVICLGNNDKIPRIFHKSFLDFITDPRRCKDNTLRITPKDHHTRMAASCLRVMNKCLKRNILCLGVPAQYLDNDEALKEENISKGQLSKKISADLQHACVHWATHVKEAGIKNTALMEELKLFADNHLLHWFEALSWVGQLSIAPHALSILMGLLKSRPDDLGATFYDAFRCVSMSFNDIHRSALHTYHSALLFIPTKRPLVYKYKKEMTHEIVDGREEWDAEITTLDPGGEVIRILFSPGSSQLASLTGFSFSGLGGSSKLAVWDATSGIALANFNSCAIISADNFSVVASSLGSTVTLHSMATNAPLTTMQYSANVKAVALSFDGSLLSAALDDGTISLWDVENETAIATTFSWDKQEYDGDLLFSISNDRLASGSLRDVSLWNVASGKLIRCLNHQSFNVKEISFFRDGSRLASADEKTLHIWDAENGESICAVSCDERKFAIPADGALVAASVDNKVQLWSGDSLSLVDTFEFERRIRCLAISAEVLTVGFWGSVELHDIKDHSVITIFKSSFTTLLAISPDSTRLAGVGGYGIIDNRIHLWEIPRIKGFVPESNDQTEITALAFSPDCSRLASGCKDGTVQLWDTTQSAHAISTHKLDSHSIYKFVFSPDGERFASRPEFTVPLRFWDGRDGSPMALFTFSGSNYSLGSLAISRHLLAIGRNVLPEISLWDHTTSCMVHRLSNEKAYLLSFSLDGSLLASTWSGLITLWDVVKGTRISTFGLFDHPSSPLPLYAEALVFLPDASKLVAEVGGEIVLVDLANNTIEQNPSHENLPWVPGPQIPHPITHVPRRFPGRNTPIPVLRLPGRVGVSAVVQGHFSLIALGCRDGRVLFVRSTPTN